LPEEDTKYFGSFTDKTFKPTQKIILRAFDTEEEASEAEVVLHNFYQVDINPHFANKAKQTSKKFCYRKAGKNHPMFGKPSARRGKTLSAETRKKISEANRGRTYSMETRKKISEANRGKTYSMEARKKMSEARRGSKRSAETRKKISEAQRGENNPMFGKTLSAETRKKMSEARRGKNNHMFGKPGPARGKIWITNGVISQRIFPTEPIPLGYRRGRISVSSF
jgi:hypothetical protein